MSNLNFFKDPWLRSNAVFSKTLISFGVSLSSSTSALSARAFDCDKIGSTAAMFGLVGAFFVKVQNLNRDCFGFQHFLSEYSLPKVLNFSLPWVLFHESVRMLREVVSFIVGNVGQVS